LNRLLYSNGQVSRRLAAPELVASEKACRH
jgi:hypothetical protein